MYLLPDYGTGAREMSWIVDTHMALHPDSVDGYGCVTGKPVTQHGINGRTGQPVLVYSMV